MCVQSAGWQVLESGQHLVFVVLEEVHTLEVLECKALAAVDHLQTPAGLVDTTAVHRVDGYIELQG